MDTKEQIEGIIQVLEHAQSRPGMYFVSKNPELAFTFLNALHIGISITARDWWDQYKHHRDAVWIKHGFEHIGANHPCFVMIRQGMENDAIIRELFTLEIETWQLLLADYDT